jgi:hypothetical protein
MEKGELLKSHAKAILVTGLLVICGLYGLTLIKGPSAGDSATAPVKATSGWTLYGSDSDGRHYYSLGAGSQPSPGIVSTWTQVVYNEEGKKRYIEKRQQHGFKTEGYDKFSHRNVLYEVNCFSEKKEICIMEVSELTGDGKTLDYAKAGTYKDWTEIPKDSVLAVLYKKVCPEKRE